MLVLSSLLLMTAAAPGSTSLEDDFVPKDIKTAVAAGCLVSGVNDSPPYAEAQVFVKFKNDTKTWDFKPVISRRGDVYKAIDDCREWFGRVKERIQATKADREESK